MQLHVYGVVPQSTQVQLKSFRKQGHQMNHLDEVCEGPEVILSVTTLHADFNSRDRPESP